MDQELLHAIFQDNTVGNKDTELENLRRRCEALEAAVLSLALGVYDVQDYVSLYSRYPRLRRKLKKCGQNMHIPLTKYHAVQLKRGAPPIQIDTKYLVESAMSLERSRVLDLFKRGYHTVAGSIYAEYEALVRKSLAYKFLEKATKLFLMFLGIVISACGLLVYIVRRPKAVIRFIFRLDVSLAEKARRVIHTWFPMLLNPERYLRDVHNDPNHRVFAELSNTLEANWWSGDTGSYSDGGQFDDTMSDIESEESGVVRVSIDAPRSQSMHDATPIEITSQFTTSPRIEPVVVETLADICPPRGNIIDDSGSPNHLDNSSHPTAQDEDSIYGRWIIIAVATVLAIIYVIL